MDMKSIRIKTNIFVIIGLDPIIQNPFSPRYGIPAFAGMTDVTEYIR
jgi:hypothetical protein